jgi:Nif-specific regulatory protein
LGEGITGQVIQSGKPMIVPRIRDEPRFLNRTEFRNESNLELSFICVPIKKGKRVIGALSVDFPPAEQTDLIAHRRRIMVIAALMAERVIYLESTQREKESLRLENVRLQEQLSEKHSIHNIVGNSRAMREVYQMVSRVSSSNATVLIRGESGTGKELIANAIHYNSSRAKKPFVKLNCAALPPDLIESELFGHEQGAFTHALRMKKGKFELANKGTIFLDEIGSISLDVQYSLLRVLQEREFERVGGTETIKTDVRIVAATNINLDEAVQDGSFREDLYYRLNVFPIYLPPMRERKTDVLLLANHFLEKYAKENMKDIRRLSVSAIDMLMEYHWPGNVRELENCIERAVLLCDGKVIHGYHLPPTIQTGEETATMPDRSLEQAVAELERDLLIDALKNTQGNMAKAASMMSLTERKFAYKAKKHNVDFRRYRQRKAR